MDQRILLSERIEVHTFYLKLFSVGFISFWVFSLLFRISSPLFWSKKFDWLYFCLLSVHMDLNQSIEILTKLPRFLQMYQTHTHTHPNKTIALRFNICPTFENNLLSNCNRPWLTNLDNFDSNFYFPHWDRIWWCDCASVFWLVTHVLSESKKICYCSVD